ESFGTNARLTEMQSALGRVQLRELPNWLQQRREFAAFFTDCFGQLPALRVSVPPDDVGHSYYKYYAFVRPERLRDGWDRDRVMRALIAEGIPCGSGSCGEIYLEKAFAGQRPPGRLPVARQLAETSLMFLVHPTLGSSEINDTCRAVEKV